MAQDTKLLEQACDFCGRLFTPTANAFCEGALSAEVITDDDDEDDADWWKDDEPAATLIEDPSDELVQETAKAMAIDDDMARELLKNGKVKGAHFCVCPECLGDGAATPDA